MTESNQTPVLKEKKAKIFYEHGKDALGLALSVASMQEEKALRKAEKHHQPQAGNSIRAGKQVHHASARRKRLEEAKAVIANRRAEAKKEKARSRKETKNRLRRGDNVNITAPEGTPRATPRKRVSFV